MTFSHIKPGDARCILLVAGVSFLVGVVLTFSVMTIMSADGSDQKISQVRYEQNLFLALECGDGTNREIHGNAEAGDERDLFHAEVCDEMRRIADAAVERYHPKAFE